MTANDLARGVGEVCIAASTLEWSLAYLTSVVRGWADDQFIDVASHPGQPLREFRALVREPALWVPELQAEAEDILADAERLLPQRHRVVHSVMIDELDPDSRMYDAWHAKTDAIWSVDPANLHHLARELKERAAAADALGIAWEERAERGVLDVGLRLADLAQAPGAGGGAAR